jgi:hypothetical protein
MILFVQMLIAGILTMAVLAGGFWLVWLVEEWL